MLPQAISLNIIFEDQELIVVNKAPGMLVHPSHRDKNDTLINALAYHFNPDNRGPVIRPGLVHRLDKETSGLIVVAKNARAHRILSSQFYNKSVEKRYLALVDGVVEDSEGTVLGAIGRFPEKKMWGLSDEGRDAETRFWVKARFDDKTLVELEPVTGRTNQLRIHCESIGHPIVGDHGRGGSSFTRLCLHAVRLLLRNINTGEPMRFETPDPDFL